MSVFRRAVAFVLSGLMAFGQPAEAMAASYVFRQPSAAGTFPIPVITNNVVNSTTYYKVDGRTYSISWQGTGGRGPYLIELVGAPLPPGCAVPVQTGSILSTTCNFNQEGTYGGIVAQLTDQNGMVVRDNAPALVVSAPAPTLSTYSFPLSGSVGIPYAGTLRVTGGRAPFSPSRATGQLPPGLSLSMVQDAMTGAWSVRLAGTPTTPGSYTFDILVTDANQKQVTSSKINISIAYGPVSLGLRPSSQTGVYRGVANKPMPDAGVTIVGGTPPVALSLAAGVMPPGLSLGPDGALVGTPTTPGTYSGIQIRAVDSATSPRVATSAIFQVVVANPLTAMLQGANDVYVRNRPISPVGTVASGGTAPYTYALTAGALPSGVTFSAATGQFSGTPTQAGRFEGLTVRVTDAGGFSTTAAPFAMVVTDPLAIAGTAPRGVAGSAYAASFTASGGTPPYSFSLAQGDLPFGLDLAEDGTLSGTPFLPGSSDGLVVRVTDADGSTKDTAPFSIVVADALAVAETPAGTATRGVAYASAFTAAGGTPPYAFALVSGSLPPGLSLASSGAVTGTPTASGSFGPFTVRLTDADGTTAAAEASIVVADPLAIAGSAGRGMVGLTYAATFSASGGKPSYTFDLSGAALPAGLTLSAEGNLSGTPTAAGTFAGIVVQATDADGRQVRTAPFPIVIDAPLRIAGDPSVSATVGQAYSATFAASGGSAPYTFSLASGTLPAGLSLSAATGVVSGTATAAGAFNGLAVRVADTAGRTATSAPFAITVSSALTVAGTASTSATVGEAYAAGFSASGGATPYAWSLASGTLPPGLSLDAATGAVAGTPTSTGSFPGIQLRVADADGRTALSAIFGISVASSLAIAGAPGTFATVGQPYSVQFTSTGGTGTKTFSLATGQLPAGLSFDTATGLISGTPTSAGFSPAIAVRVRDASNSAATAPAFDLRVSDPLVVSGTPAPDATVGADYSGFATLTGGRGPFAWTLAAGTLPPGLSLAPSTGAIGGRPTAPGTSSGLQLRVVDADGRTGTTAPFAIAVTAALAVAGTAGPGTVGEAYTAQFTASGGQTPHVYALLGSALPAGLTLDAATGRISGTPTAAAPAGTSQIQVTDATGRTATTAAFGIDVRDPLRLVATNVGPGTVGLAYAGAMTPAGGRAPYTLVLTAGSLPPGVTLSASSGALSGTPTQAGSYGGLVVRATDADGRSATSAAFAIEVAAGLTVAGLPPQAATVGVPYAFAFSASGGAAPYAWSLGGGSLPSGITIDPSTGSLGGIPTRAGTVTGLAALVQDAVRRTGTSQAFAIDVRDPVTVTGSPAGVAPTGQSYSAAFAASGGRGPFVYAMVGTLPAGLTLSASSGTISGTPAAATEVTGLQVRATDQDGRTGVSAAFSISVVQPLTLAGTAAATADVGAPYASRLTAAGGRQPYVYALSAGTLPGGLTLDGSTGEIVGTPSAPGLSSGLQVRVTDANGTTATSQTFAIAVADPLAVTAQAGPATVGATYAGAVVATGGRGPFIFSLSAGALPAGLQLDSTSGRISGTPRNPGRADDLQVRVVDADGRASTTQPFSITVSGPLAVVGLGIPNQIGTVGVAYDAAVSASGGDAPYIYALAAGSLPLGLTLDASTGRVSGTPTAAGLSSGLQISVSDSQGRTATTGVFQIDVRDPVAVAGNPAVFGTVGSGYGPSTFSASGGRGPIVFSAIGALPAGLNLNPNSGILSGTPGRAGIHAGLQIRATDQDGRFGLSASFTIEVSPAFAISGSLPQPATVGSAYAGGFAAQGGRPPYAYGVASGTLPPGLGLDAASGQIAGAPSSAGTFPGIQIRATDQDGRTATSAAATIAVSDPLQVSGSPASIGTVGSSYGPAQFVTSGGRGPFVYALQTGTLPSGLTLNASGRLSGTPAAAVDRDGLQVRATDADGRIAYSAPFRISISAPLALSASLPGTASVGSAYSGKATASGGRSPFSYSLAGGSLPPGLDLDAATGAVTGLPTTTGNYAGIVIRVADADGRTTATASYAVSVTLPLTASYASLAGVQNSAFSLAPSVSGGRSGYTFALVSGTLPSGLGLNATSGLISGTPTVAQTAAGLQVRVTDAEGRTSVSDPFSIAIATPLAMTVAASYTGGIGNGLTVQPTASGGRQPYSWSVSPDVPGMSMDAASGVYSGTPAAARAGANALSTFRVTDADGRTVTRQTYIYVTAPLALDGPVQSFVDRGVAYSGSMRASGGTGPYTFRVTGGWLPSGLSFYGGTFSGTTQGSGTYAVEVEVKDNAGLTATRTVVLTVSDPIQMQYNGAKYFNWGHVGRYFETREPRLVNGRQPFKVTVSPQLPDGLTADVIGDRLRISGTPTAVSVSKTYSYVFTDADNRVMTWTNPFQVYPEPAQEWANYDWTNKNAYGSLGYDLWTDRHPVAMSKDGRTHAFAYTGTTNGSGSVKVFVDTGVFRYDLASDRYPANYGIAPLQTIPAPPEAGGFGTKLSLSRDGTWLVVAAPVGSPPSPNVHGYVYVYHREGDQFVLHSRTDLDRKAGFDQVRISDDGQLLVYTYEWLTASNTYAAATSLSRWSGGAWVREARLGNGSGGIEISRDGSTVALGGGPNIGIYNRVGGAWTLAYTTPTVAASGGPLAIGSSIVMNAAGTMVYGAAVTRPVSTSGQTGMYSLFAYSNEGGAWKPVNGYTYSFTNRTGFRDDFIWINSNDDLSQVVFTSMSFGNPGLVHFTPGSGITRDVPILDFYYVFGPLGGQVLMDASGTVLLSSHSGVVAKSSKF